MAFQGETKLRVSELKFELMKQFLDCEKHDSHRRFNIFGFAACRHALASVLGMSKNKVTTLIKQCGFGINVWLLEALFLSGLQFEVTPVAISAGKRTGCLLGSLHFSGSHIPTPKWRRARLLEVVPCMATHFPFGED